MRRRVTVTCEALGLDVERAKVEGAQVLLPEAARNRKAVREFPLPYSKHELARLMEVPVPTDATSPEGMLIRRIQKRWYDRVTSKEPGKARLSTARSERSIEVAKAHAKTHIDETLAEIATSAKMVHAVAEKVTGSLTDLYDLCRQSLEGQLRAHLTDGEWHGERIDAQAARECFRLVTQAVKGFGLPREADKRAAGKISMEETAAAIRETQEALSLAPNKDEKPN